MISLLRAGNDHHLAAARVAGFGGARHSGDAPARQVVHVVDTDQPTRSALASMFTARGLETRSYANLDDFAAAPRGDGPGCLVVEVLGRSIGEFGRQARLQPLGMPMVVTANRPDVWMAVEAMKAGAIDFLERPLREQEIVQAVDAALETDREQRAVRAQRTAVRERFERLTKREREVMALVTAGRLNKQVAGDLGLSEITVKVHRGSVMRKMAARTLVDLVRMADVINDAPNSPTAPWPRLACHVS